MFLETMEKYFINCNTRSVLKWHYNSFGSIMPGREYTAQSAAGYRFGFNTQEKDDEIYGKGNASSAEFWEYDTRLGRRWNLDPEFKKYADETPYLVLHNNPSSITDFKGDEPPKKFQKS